MQNRSFYRAIKQNLGLTSCYAQTEAAHLAHMELLFTAKTLICFATWEELKLWSWDFYLSTA